MIWTQKLGRNKELVGLVNLNGSWWAGGFTRVHFKSSSVVCCLPSLLNTYTHTNSCFFRMEHPHMDTNCTLFQLPVHHHPPFGVEHFQILGGKQFIMITGRVQKLLSRAAASQTARTLEGVQRRPKIASHTCSWWGCWHALQMCACALSFNHLFFSKNHRQRFFTLCAAGANFINWQKWRVF